MADYSYSRLNTFDTCPYQYYLRYIRGETPEYDTTEEAFMGSMVHMALEKLYRDRTEGKIDNFMELSHYYREVWNENASKTKIKATSRDGIDALFEKGEDMLARYFCDIFIDDDSETIEIEGNHIMELPDGNGYYIRMDRLARKDGVYYVCDYKTGSTPGSQYEADMDAQLPMYALWVRRNYPDADKVKLVWYTLKRKDDIVLTSSRSLAQMEKLEKETVLRIRDIECCEEFPLVPTKLCKWCAYEGFCHGGE